jgi:hypothetical protein
MESFDQYVATSGGVDAYPCCDCHGWHVGRLKKNAHLNKYLKATA